MDYVPEKPYAADKHSLHHVALHQRIFQGGLLVAGAGVNISTNDKGQYIVAATARAGALAGWHFESKIEVDPTRAYPAQSVIHIQPTHALVTTGIRDAANPSGGLVTSCAGFWVATQNVPPQTTSGGHDVWNLPQWPLPVSTDFDDPGNFWLYLGEMDCGL